jgi:hypothetical protein
MLRKKSNAGTGKGFTFHGSYTSQILARRKERDIPGSFIIKRGSRYYVLKPKVTARSNRVVAKKSSSVNPKGWTKIYDTVTRVEAMKGSQSLYPGQKFFHNFKRPYPAMYGSPDGKMILIKMKWGSMQSETLAVIAAQLMAGSRADQIHEVNIPRFVSMAAKFFELAEKHVQENRPKQE